MKKITMILVFVLMSLQVFSQIEVKYFNAEWNAPNEVEWVDNLSDCEVEKLDIGKTPELAQKHKVVVVPTIIVFQDGEESKRYQADLSFKIDATREEIQDYIDELIMSAF